ncbi:hypothetical protein ACIBQ0_16965 [Nocardia nova]|uniref:hypothetical protein n=1 Tax=Nocardia nova TaxID=37330 RepID=UPI002738A403|nr:hypothetical protein [Nocardia nova]
MSNEIQAFTDSDLAYRIVLLKTLADLVNQEFRDAKALAAEQFAKGASIPARTDNDDVKLGRVTKSDPKPVAEIVDRDELDAYIRDQHPDKLERRVVLGDIAEVLPILIDAGRMDLFTEVEDIPDWLVGQMKAAALNGRPIPGIALRRPDGVVSARTERAAETAVRQLLSGARVPLLRGLEA